MSTKKWLLVALSVFLLAGAGCKKKPAFPTCKKDADCRVDATGKEINGVCYMGKCEECIEHTDCPDAKQCVNNRCVTLCQEDDDCGADEHCDNDECVTNCMGDETCPGDLICSQGRCVMPGMNDNAFMSDTCQTFESVLFDFDRYEVKAQYEEQLAHLAQCLEKAPGSTIILEGHTDDRGTPSYNMALGQKRADAVKNYLKTKWGIAQNRMRTISYGEQQPKVNEKNEYAWQQNRRVEFKMEKN